MNTPFMRKWAVPIILAILTLVGLISALVGDGLWDLVSAFALGVPVVLCLWFGLRRRTRND